MTRHSRIAGFLVPLALATLMLSGCSDDGLGRRYKVSGSITYKGAPVEKGMIMFISDAPDGRGATGMIEKGSYTLQTQEPGDGAFPGTYKVTVTSKTPDLAAAADAAKKKGATSAYVPGEFVTATLKKAKDEVPTKYGTLNPNNNLSATVKESSNTINFELVD